MKAPELILLRRQFPEDHLLKPADWLLDRLQSEPRMSHLRRGQTVALCVGSRGIHKLPDLVSSVVEAVRARGCVPWILPCMGSHGGATAEGQAATLAGLGVTESTAGCPIRATMDVVEIGTTADGVRVIVDSEAARADHLIPINRIKPHTDFNGPVQSGLMKMLAVGLGNHVGAESYHRAFRDFGFQRTIRSAANVIVRSLSVPFGVAVVENEIHHILRIELVRPARLFRAEKRLLCLASRRMARLPLRRFDLLIIDQMGKEVSGSGIDTNVVGLKGQGPRERANRDPEIPHIYLRGLSALSGGNAVGIGLASYVHRRILTQVDWDATYTNCLTSGTPYGAALPIHFESDEGALDAIARGMGKSSEEMRIIRIRDTLNLRALYVSRSLLPDLPAEQFEIEDTPSRPGYDHSGNCVPDLTPSN